MSYDGNKLEATTTVFEAGKIEKPEKPIIKKNKINHKKIIIFSIIAIIIIIGLIFIIGYFRFDWFQHKQDNVVDPKRETNQVLRYKLESKVQENYDLENEEETNKTNENFINGEYIITINKKKRLSYFGEIDYEYNATILFLNLTKLNTTNNEENYGSELVANIYQNLEINATNLLICNFIFYQNGTLGDIFLPKNMQEDYQIFMFNIINATIPKISKSLYKKEEDIRNLDENSENLNIKEESFYKINYENNLKNETTIHENLYKKNLKSEATNSTIEGSESTQEKISKFDGKTDEMTKVEIEGNVKLKSQTKKNRRNLNETEIINDNEENNKTTLNNENQEESNFGYKGYEGIVSSNITLISNKIEENTTKIVQNLASKNEYINYKDINKNDQNNDDENIINEGNSTIEENEEYSLDNITDNEDEDIENKKRNLDSRPNFYSGWTVEYKIISGNILGINVQLLEYLTVYSSSFYRSTYAKIKIGKIDLNFARLSSYYLKNTKETKTFNIINLEHRVKIFDINIWIARLSIEIVFGLKVTNNLYSYIQSKEMNAKALLNSVITTKLATILRILFFRGGVDFTGEFLNGSAYILLRTRNRYSDKYTDLLYGVNLNAVDIYIYFYTEYWFFGWNKIIDKTVPIYSLNLFKRDYSKILY